MNRPWLNHYGPVPHHLTYPAGSMSDAVTAHVHSKPEQEALSFMGRRITYRALGAHIARTARAFKGLGIRKGDRVTLCMPNIPQTVYCLYALNEIGAVVSIIHPLSAEKEIVFYLNEVESGTLVTLHQFYDKIMRVQQELPLKHLIITDIDDALAGIRKAAYRLAVKRKFPPVQKAENLWLWRDFLALGEGQGDYKEPMEAGDGAVILFSGGTTGTQKGILLSNGSFNAVARQTVAMCNRPVQGKRMLAAMPMFHGFGLGVCVHTVLAEGASAILVPRFNVKDYAGLIKKEKPNYIAGVPTLYEALTRTRALDRADLSCLLGVFSGGDSLSIELKRKMDRFLAERGATVRIREGYGTTECVTASCLTPDTEEREGSIGLPYPDMDYKICRVGTTEEVPCGEEGEICLRGPSVMIGYLNHPADTEEALRLHPDGQRWLHTGDLGSMDSDGFIYFRQRLKRIIVTNGYNVYPSQIENVLDGHPKVQISCVIGVPDPYRMQRVKAFVVPKAGVAPGEALRRELLEYCRIYVAKYACPRELEFREDLPKTLVGKVAYKQLEEECLEAQKS
ncbi:MAG: AMP-dependent synthetase [Clostridiales bacterium]|nr:MAG: AMP-dependent synthetase [Clostridiales bacterium]